MVFAHPGIICAVLLALFVSFKTVSVANGQFDFQAAACMQQPWYQKYATMRNIEREEQGCVAMYSGYGHG